MGSRFSIILFIIWGYAIQDTLPYAQQQRTQQTSRTHISPKNNQEYGFQTVYTASAYVPIDHTGSPLKIVPEAEKKQYFFVTSNKNETTLPSLSQSTSTSSIYMGTPTYHHKISYLNENDVLKNRTYYPHHINDNTQQYQQHQPSQQKYFQSEINYNRLAKSQGNIHHLHNHHHLKHRRLRHRTNGAGDCIKCPPEKILIAQKGLDGVLIEQPKLFSCNNRAILNTAYYIETLFGSSFNFLLPHGSHSLHGKIKNKSTGNVVQTCMLRFKVIVQQCGRFFPQDKNIKVICDPGYIWGSKCSFTCRRGYVSTNSAMVCGDNLHWEGEEPECLLQPPPNRSQSCDFLGIPDNGRFSCEYPNNINSDDFENELVTPNGTICRVKCNRNYEIESGWENYSTLKCHHGKWNSTIPNLCKRKRRSSYLK